MAKRGSPGKKRRPTFRRMIIELFQIQRLDCDENDLLLPVLISGWNQGCFKKKNTRGPRLTPEKCNRAVTAIIYAKTEKKNSFLLKDLYYFSVLVPFFPIISLSVPQGFICSLFTSGCFNFFFKKNNNFSTNIKKKNSTNRNTLFPRFCCGGRATIGEERHGIGQPHVYCFLSPSPFIQTLTFFNYFLTTGGEEEEEEKT